MRRYNSEDLLRLTRLTELTLDDAHSIAPFRVLSQLPNLQFLGARSGALLNKEADALRARGIEVISFGGVYGVERVMPRRPDTLFDPNYHNF